MNSTYPQRGEIWDVNLDPTVGQEINKTRPAVILSTDGIGKLRLKVIVPITAWKPEFDGNQWHVKISPRPSNGLSKESVADALHLRSVGVERFLARRGRLDALDMEEIAAAVATIIEFR